jgi:hypothetical protein
MKNILLSSLFALVLISVVGCSDTSSTPPATTTSAPMQPDTKDMKK